MNSLQLNASCLVIGLLLRSAAAEPTPVQGERWPTLPEREKISRKDYIEEVPGPVLPPVARAPDADPFVPLATMPAGVKGTLLYFAKGDLVWRSLGSSRLMPLPDRKGQGSDLRSDVATYGFANTEFGTSNVHLSPNGHILAFEDGRGLNYRDGWHPISALWEWDTQNNRVVNLVPNDLVGSEAATSEYQWSSDSRSIAYVTGNKRSYQLERMCIVNRLTRKIQPLVLPKQVSLLSVDPSEEGRPDFQTFCWASSTALLFSAAPPSKNLTNEDFRPSIYEFKAGKSRLVVPNAYAPNPSPDGRWIACFAWPSANSETGPDIYLFDRQRGKRLFVRALPRISRSNYITSRQTLRWSSDSRRLVVSDVSYEETQKAGQGVAAIFSLAIPARPSQAKANWSKSLHLITTLRVDDAVGEPVSSPGIRFAPLQVSRDNTFLWMQSLRITGAKREKVGKDTVLQVPTLETSLQRLNLTTGQVDVLARFNNHRLRGFDWHEESR